MDKAHGWCGTCNPDASEGERGYCPYYPDEEPEDDEEQNTIVKTSKNWGFCSASCMVDDYYSRKLQETKITVLKDKECNIFANEDSGLNFVAGIT